MSQPTATDTTVIARAKLSCNHVIDIFDAEVREGDKVHCTATRCTEGKMVRRSRRVKRLTPVTPAEVTEREADAADARIDALVADVLADRPQVADVAYDAGEVAEAIAEAEAAAYGDRTAELADEHAARGADAHTAQVMAEADREVEQALAAEPTPEPAAYDTIAARDEHRALQAWVKAGSQGERPSTTNLDAMNEAHAAGKPRPSAGRKASRSTTPRTSARRAEANRVQKEIGFEGRKAAGVVKWTDAELADWMRQVAEANPGTRKEDELEQCYWIARVAVSRSRFYRVWAETFDA
jgi:hypothetical protein